MQTFHMIFLKHKKKNSDLKIWFKIAPVQIADAELDARIQVLSSMPIGLLSKVSR